jgi:hypothetical protein
MVDDMIDIFDLRLISKKLKVCPSNAKETYKVLSLETKKIKNTVFG